MQYTHSATHGQGLALYKVIRYRLSGQPLFTRDCQAFVPWSRKWQARIFSQDSGETENA